MQTKSTTRVDDDYICKLSLEVQKIAETELRETNEIREHALRSLRDWAEKNSRIISMRLDANFLLRFLRCKKYSLPMTKEMLERYLVLRHYEQNGEKLFQNFDMRLPAIKSLLELGYIFALPKRDSHGRRIILVRPSVFNPQTYRNFDMIKIHGIVYETLLENETNQVQGFVHIIDASNLGFNYLTIFTPQEAYRIGKNLEKLLPMRHKAIHGLKVHPSIKFAVDFALSKMTPKMKQRVFLHKNHEDIRIDKSLMPSEYGGEIPMQQMIDEFINELEAKRDVLIKNDKMSINLQMYPLALREGSVRSLKKSIEEIESSSAHANFDFQGVQGSFRKLEID